MCLFYGGKGNKKNNNMCYTHEKIFFKPQFFFIVLFFLNLL